MWHSLVCGLAPFVADLQKKRKLFELFGLVGRLGNSITNPVFTNT